MARPRQRRAGRLVRIVQRARLDSQNAWGSWSFSVRVTQPNLPPDVAPIPNQSVSAGAAFLYDVRASDPNGDPLTYSLDAASLAWASNRTAAAAQRSVET